MNSRRSSRFSQSPTVVQSPASLSSHRVSSPVTPVLQVDMDRVPFSESFPGIIRARHEYNDSFYSSGCEGVNNGGIMTHSSSFHIERITNIKEIDPQWEHDEIEEIMVISPKARTRSSFLDLGSSNRLSVPDFEVLQVLGKEPSIQTILARSLL
ncbi:hypothetical protein DFH11DRAFT_67112 [Phellopilus nigrolimitatus]|nr:hypothetical protein DFH11DRAFT_67112 [Phellopilus nigrolimitatus]